MKRLTQKTMAVMLMCFMLLSTLTVGITVSAAVEKEPINTHVIDFEEYEEAVYEADADAENALTCFDQFNDNLFSYGTVQITSDENYGKIMRINKTKGSTLYAGNGSFYFYALYENGVPVHKSNGKLIVEFDVRFGNKPSWASALQVVPFARSGASVFSAANLVKSTNGGEIPGTNKSISDSEWHHAYVEFNLDACKYNARIDDIIIPEVDLPVPEDAANHNIYQYRIGTAMSRDYVDYDNITTSYIAPYTSEELEALASISANANQNVGKAITVIPTFEEEGLESAALYFEDTLITDAAVNGEAVTYVIPKDTTPGTYSINLSLTYTNGRQATKSQTIEVCAQGEPVNQHLIDFEEYEEATYTTNVAANAALAPLTDFTSNIFNKASITIKQSEEGDGHGKILAYDNFVAQMNVNNGFFMLPANMEAGKVVAKDTGKIVLEFDIKYKMNWNSKLCFVPVSAGMSRGTRSTIIDGDSVVGGKSIKSEDEKWIHVKLTCDLDKQTFSGSVGNYPVAEASFALSTSEPNLAYFMIDPQSSGAAANYINFDNFATYYIAPIEYTAEELESMATIEVSSRKVPGQVINITPSFEASKLDSAALYFGETLISDSAAYGKTIRYYIPEDTAFGDYDLTLKLIYKDGTEVTKTETVTVAAVPEAVESNFIDFEEYSDKVYETSDSVTSEVADIVLVNGNLFNYGTLEIATVPEKGKVVRLNKTKGNTLYAGNGRFDIPAVIENDAMVLKRTGSVVVDFDFAFGAENDWASAVQIVPYSKSGHGFSGVNFVSPGRVITGTGVSVADTDWHHAHVVFDVDNFTYTAMVDDTLLPAGALTPPADPGHYDFYKFMIGTAMSTGSTLYDNFKVSYIEGPAYKNATYTKSGEAYSAVALVASDAEELKLNVNVAYADSVASMVKLFVNGTEQTVEAAYASKVITVPLTGLEIAEGDEIRVYVSHDAVLSDGSYVNQPIDVTFTAAAADYIFTVADGKANAIIEIDAPVAAGSKCFMAAYKGDKLVGITTAKLSPAFYPSAHEAAELTLPADYDSVKCLVLNKNAKPLIDALVK